MPAASARPAALGMAPASRKRSRPEPTPINNTAEAPATAKKQRLNPPAPKFYAVRKGQQPGVYTNWDDCQTQIVGFGGAQYKSFATHDDANDFVAGKNIGSPSNPGRFYAVAVGNPIGIYTDWESVSLAIKGVKGPKYKKFTTRQDAITFIRLHAKFNDDDPDHLDDEDDPALSSQERHHNGVGSQPPPQPPKPPLQPDVVRVAPAEKTPLVKDSLLVIHTDGSSLSNGKACAVAGVGVYFGVADPRNVSEPLAGDLQTNQRAELTAILRALQLCPESAKVVVVTDSQYSINCVTVWAASWVKKGWLTAAGFPVKNADLVRAVVARMAERRRVGGSTEFRWVKGHSDDPGNLAADQLAVLAARAQAAKRGRA